MAYSGFNTGGASTYDLYRLAAGAISGHISAPLTTTEGVMIATRDGVEILAHIVRTEHERDESVIASAVAGVVRTMEADKRECLDGLYELTANLIRGCAITPLLTANGEQIGNRNRIALAAVKKL